ncbi:MAG: ABC transporter permease [Deltaproteobacteria bacterium]|nr:ABC transporter permease [Deltaproteobacteria bacterium]
MTPSKPIPPRARPPGELRTLGWVAAGLLALLHGGLAALPEPPLELPANFVLFATNLYVLYCAGGVLSGRGVRVLAWFLAGYGALYGLTVVALGKTPLFILLMVVYASVFGSPVLLGFFGIFVLSFVILQPYAFETFIPLVMIYVVLVKARGASTFMLTCLGAGLAVLALVLLPLIHLMLRDSAQTLWVTLERPDVQQAIWLSVGSSTVATLCIVVWGVPLAWALCRLDSSQRRWIEPFVDLPILIPQPVVGIALISMVGPGSALGEGLERVGLGISGTFAAIVIAQVFVASPFLIKTAMTAFEGVPTRLELASRSLGCSPFRTFWQISVPLASRGLVVGLALAWARAVSEFGSVILFASSPVTAPVLVHTEFVRAGTSEARPIAILVLIICLWIFVILQFGQTLIPFALQRERGKRA